MSYKRRKTGPSSGFRPGRNNTPNITGAPSSSNPASSAGFQTPPPRKFPKPTQSSKAGFSRQGSVLQTSVPPSTPQLPPLPAQRRVSFRPPTSHLNTQSARRSSRHGHDDDIESEADIQAREDADALNEIVMAIDMKEKGTVGCAYYIAREEKLFLMEDIKLAGLDIVDTVKLHAQPTVLLISTKSDEALENHLMKEAKGIGNGDDNGKSFIFHDNPTDVNED
jgi:DNA mismatch repair protein MSH5